MLLLNTLTLLLPEPAMQELLPKGKITQHNGKCTGKLRRNGRQRGKRKQESVHFVLHTEMEESAFLKRLSKICHILTCQNKAI